MQFRNSDEVWLTRLRPWMLGVWFAVHCCRMMSVLLMCLCLLLTTPTGVQPHESEEIHVKAREMVQLQCPQNKSVDADVIWTSHTTQSMDLTAKTSPAERRQMGVLVHGRRLVILNATVNHQGNYSCSLRKASRQSWFRLTVHTETREYLKRSNTYLKSCFTEEACIMQCPSVIAPVEGLKMTNQPIIWHKEGESVPKDSYFSSVQETDQGVYTCTRSYLYEDHLYNMTFVVELSVEPSEKVVKSATIISPRTGDVFPVDLGSTVVIDCKAVLYSEIDEVYWLSGGSFVEKNSNFPVYYNETREVVGEEIKVTVSLIFKKVSEDDLLQNYTCKLETEELFNFVTITLAQKFRPSRASLVVSIVCVVVVMGLAVVIYVKFKINITLFLRDTLDCRRSTPDGKSYDVFLMFYKSSTDPGLNEDEKTWLKTILEERFGYSLCLYDRDVLPGKAVSEAVLDCIEQSRTVALVPTSPDPALGSGLLSAIHEALVERQTGLVFIKTEAAEASRSGSIPEALQLLGEAGDCVTWKGSRSMPPSSSFWKQLRYYLPAPHMTPKIRLLPKI